MSHEHSDPRSLTQQPAMEHGRHTPTGQSPDSAAHGAPLHGGENGDHAAHNKHAGHDPDVFRRQFWIVLLLTVPVVVWSHEVMMWLGFTAPEFPGSEWVSPILGTIVFGYGGRVFLEGARTELRDR